MGGVGSPEVAETGGVPPEGVAPAVAELRTGRVPVKEAGLVPQPETVLPSSLAMASATPSGARRVPVRPVGGMVVLIPAPRMGEVGPARVARDARVAEMGPVVDPIVKEAGYPAPRPVRRPVTGPGTAEAVGSPSKAAGQVAIRVADHGAVGNQG